MNPAINSWWKYPGDRYEILGKVFLNLDPASASKARAHVREWLGDDHPAYENVRLATSELVTNAVLHARRRNPGDLVSFTLARREELLRVEVLDPGGGPWRPREPGGVPGDGERGRGLGIVAEVSRNRWGVRDLGERGRVVWCAIDGEGPPCG
ncbi:ATP-binding protein [Streptosporangium longisporum]|uniref:Histidine kinase/HSP90-like ATPase domain-containing protein n=1 Tax=Streptosporangium longisporum TaxID=46187 RepID=A0ABN3XP95_9ACTN